MKKSTLLFAILLAVCTLSAQKQVSGSGNAITQDRKLPTFTILKNTTFVNVVIVQAKESKAIVKADGNVINHVLTQVEDNTLTISMERGISYGKSSNYITVEVHTPHLSELVNSGTGNVTINSLKEEKFTLANKGTGDVSSSCLLVSKTLVMTSGGTGNLNISFMAQGDVIIKNAGTGDMVLDVIQNVTSSMKIQNSGTGDITLKKLSVGDLQLRSLGTGNVTLSGKADNMTLVNNGTGNVQANKLSVKTAHIIQNSVGGINAYVTEKAYLTRKNKTGDLKITGGGEVVMETSIEEIREFLNE
jgi:hypothetical protein